MEIKRQDPGVRYWKIGAGISALVLTIGAILVWQVDLFHLHFSYSDVKKDFLASGMPWTSEDLYKGITPEQVKKRTELAQAAKSILEDYKLTQNHRYDEISKVNSAKRLKELAHVNERLNRIRELSDAPLIGLVDLNAGFYYDALAQSDLKRAVQVLSLRGEWKVIAGQFEEGTRDFEASYRIAKHLGDSETFLGYIIGSAALVVTDASLVRAASAVKGNLPQLKALENLMSESNSSHPLPVNAFKGEALSHIAYARNADVLHDISTLIMQSGLPGAVKSPTMKSGDPRTMARRSLAVAFMRLWAEVGESIKKHPEDQEKWFAALRSGVGKAIKKGGMAGGMIDFCKPDPDLLSDTFKRSKTLRLVNLSLLRGTRMSLEGKTDSAIRAAMDTDPYSGKPLIWKSDGTTFTVWSVGPNRSDDGGISRKDFEKLMGDAYTGPEAYDVPATIPWKPEPRPSSSPATGSSSVGGPLPSAADEDR